MDNNFLLWLKKELDLREVSLRGIAKKADFSASYISEILSAKKPVTWNFVAAISLALNEPIWKLAIMAGLINSVSDDVVQDEETRSLIKSFYDLPLEGRKEVLDYIKWVGVKYKKTP